MDSLYYKQEFWLRFVYRASILARELTTIFRPNLPKYTELFKPGLTVPIRILRHPGKPEADIPPEFTADKVTAKVKSINCRNIKTLKNSDFVGSSPDVHDEISLRYHLGLIYDGPFDDPRWDQGVIKIELEYF